jgi:mevalonate kinase
MIKHRANMKIKAPGVVKLVGEHAVLYNKTAVAAAIEKFATVEYEIEPDVRDQPSITIELKDLETRQMFSHDQLCGIYNRYMKKRDIATFITGEETDPEILPFAVIASAMLVSSPVYEGVSTKYTLSSEVAQRGGVASSAACSTAFGTAASVHWPINGESELVDIIRHGERLLNQSPNAGEIDVNTSSEGGIVSFSKAAGARQEASSNVLATFPPIVIIDTGPKESTSVMVGRVAALRKENEPFVEKIFNQMQDSTTYGLAALDPYRPEVIGREMRRTHYLLSELGVSTPKLDEVVSLSEKANAYGAKLSGGGGGGIAIAITETPKYLVQIMRDAGFKAYQTRVTAEGAKQSLKSTNRT